ncbi:ferritin-like domain-containing protein [Pelosinus propionicus]|uniref:Rubrerythrin n=1 Tax=Pelosinus propionicus DSM 13327 TaxID=1123291 RepID=A0A1I4GZA2_9FIRM|nr:ferritin family protein [Pelosinus propionicus]SFL35378.1 Rubrerythrin [Pelosinus propionicus DSM 13327]
MDIFDFALQMELDGEKYYRDLADKVRDNDLKTVLEGLAEDEQRHYKIIQLAQSQIFNPISDSSLHDMPNVFSRNKEKTFVLETDLIAKLKDEQSDVYRAALLKEEESVALYKRLQEDSNHPEAKLIFKKLMQEEEKHVEVIENIIEMLNHVNDWVEAAEFNPKRDAY